MNSSLWNQYKLGDLVKLTQGFCVNKKSNHLVVDSGLPLLRITDMINGNEEIFISYNVPKRFIAKEEDIIFTRTGQVGLVFRGQHGVIHNNCFSVSPLSDNITRNFLYWLLRSDIVRKKASYLAGGAAQPDLKHPAFKSIVVKIPVKISTQEIISEILSDYDNFIDTNRRRVQLLEEAAQLLFREWFIYFKFPDHEKVRIVEGVPEGWKKEKLNKLVYFLGGHAFKSSSYQQEGKYGIVTIKNVQQGNFITECTDYLDDAPDTMKKHCFLSNGDILLSLTGNVGRVCLVYGENYLLNQRVAKIEPKNTTPKSFIYWMFDDSIMQKRVENLSYGSAQQNLSPVKLGEQSVIFPPILLLESFDEIVSLINIEIIQLLKQNQKLAQARDLLLPRLMSGAIEV